MQTFSYISTKIVRWITSNTDPKWARFSLSEWTDHQASHYMLVGGNAEIPVS